MTADTRRCYNASCSYTVSFDKAHALWCHFMVSVSRVRVSWSCWCRDQFAESFGVQKDRNCQGLERNWGRLSSCRCSSSRRAMFADGIGKICASVLSTLRAHKSSSVFPILGSIQMSSIGRRSAGFSVANYWVSHTIYSESRKIDTQKKAHGKINVWVKIPFYPLCQPWCQSYVYFCLRYIDYWLSQRPATYAISLSSHQ